MLPSNLDINKKLLKKCHRAMLIILAFSIGYFLYWLVSPKDFDIAKYYKIINDNPRQRNETTTNINYNHNAVRTCMQENTEQKRKNCLEKYYISYTLKHGEASAFAHLTETNKAYPETITYCHDISHGIGEGSYLRNNKDITRTLQTNVSRYFNNITSCANGFYHGVSIGMSKYVNNEKDLIKKMTEVCDDVFRKSNGNDTGDSCAHGIGHAIMTYFEYDKDKTANICEKIYNNKNQDNYLFHCYSGMYMEDIVQQIPKNLYKYGNDTVLDRCKDTTGTKREACFLEHSSAVISIDGFRNPLGIMKACQEFDDKILRKACSKLKIQHAIRLWRTEQVKYMCNLPTTREERQECLHYFMYYLASSVDRARGEIYNKVVQDVCRTQDIFAYLWCMGMAQELTNIHRSFQTYHVWPRLSDYKFLLNLFY